MSASITLSENSTWWASALFWEKLIEQVKGVYPGQFPDYPDLHDTLCAVSALGDFSVDYYDRDFGAFMARMIYTVAKDAKDGFLQPGPVLNASGVDRQGAYVQSLAELVAMFDLDGKYTKRL